MPLIQVKLIKDVFTPGQKQEIIRKLTDAMVEIEAENMRRSPGASWRRSRAAIGRTSEDHRHMIVSVLGVDLQQGAVGPLRVVLLQPAGLSVAVSRCQGG